VEKTVQGQVVTLGDDVQVLTSPHSLMDKVGLGADPTDFGLPDLLEDGIPRDENERGELAATLQATAAEMEIPESDLWYDPIVVPVSSQQQQVISCTAFMSMVTAIAPEAKSTCGLSNVSNGSPEKLRPTSMSSLAQE